MITKEFVLAGNATFTVEPPTNFIAARAALGETWHPRYTYRVERVEMDSRADPRVKDTFYFAKSMTGPDNTADYVYVGVVHPTLGTVRLTGKSAFPYDSTRVKVLMRVLSRIFAGEAAKITEAGWTVHHEGRCGRCGRALTVPSSIESGIGPECARKIRCTKINKAKATGPLAALRRHVTGKVESGEAEPIVEITTSPTADAF